MTPPSQTELERALTEIRRLSQCSKYYIEQFEFIEAAAKRIPALEAKLKEVEKENTTMIQTLCFFASVIKSGEPWTGTRQLRLDEALNIKEVK